MATPTLVQANVPTFAPSTVDKLITGDELFAMGDIGRTELVEGRIAHLIPTGYKHGYYEVNIASELFNFVKAHKLGRVLGGEVGVYTARNPDSVRVVDAAFISHERYAKVRSHSYLDVCPELLVEVLSPDDSWSDVHEKLGEYFSIETQIVWVVDPRLEQIHIYRSLDDVTRLTIDDELTGGNILPGFRIPVREIFDTEE
ncbi:MAG: Uma2 family endonuclease [Chloroflexota bacterium]